MKTLTYVLTFNICMLFINNCFSQSSYGYLAKGEEFEKYHLGNPKSDTIYVFKKPMFGSSNVIDKIPVIKEDAKILSSANGEQKFQKVKKGDILEYGWKKITINGRTRKFREYAIIDKTSLKNQ